MNQGNSVEIPQSGQEEELVYIRLVGKASTKASSGLRPEESSHEKVCGEIVPSRGSNKVKGSEARTRLAECKKAITSNQITQGRAFQPEQHTAAWGPPRNTDALAPAQRYEEISLRFSLHKRNFKRR